MTTNSSHLRVSSKSSRLSDRATECERIAQKSQTDRQSLEPAIRRESSEHLADAGQQELYWLIWAAVLAGLALRIFGS